jgi:hypothetical protein
MNQQTFDFDNRAGTEASLDAFKSILHELPQRRRVVLEAIAELGTATAKEVAAYLGVPLNTISGRFSELSDTTERALIEAVVVDQKVLRRDGSVVYRVKK